MLLAVLVVVVPAVVAAKTLPIRQPTIVKDEKFSAREQARLRSLAHQVGAARASTWACQDKFPGAKRSKASSSVWALPRSASYRAWVLDRWKARAVGCQEALKQRRLVTWDWLTAVNLVQRAYPGTKDWLLFISRREGGWGRFVMNTQGSGAGGWMQFMSSTYYAYNSRAFADIRRRGFVVDDQFNAWQQPLGQAVTAGYMRYVGLDGCHWCLG